MNVHHTMHFDPRGGSVSVQLVPGFAQRGNYFVELLDNTGRTVIERFPPEKGSAQQFSTADADTVPLRTPPSKLSGTIVSVTANVLLVPPFSHATVFVTLLQGQKLGTASDDATGDLGAFVEVDVAVALAGGAVGGL